MNTSPILPIMAACLLCACATVTTEAPSLTFSPPSVKGASWKLGGKLVDSPLSETVTLYINDTEVASGSLDAVNHLNVQITGNYEQHIVLGVCSINDKGKTECDVSVDSFDAGKLEF